MVGGGNDLAWSDLESQRGQYVLAHNGWVMDADPLVNFAAEGTKVSNDKGRTHFSASQLFLGKFFYI